MDTRERQMTPRWRHQSLMNCCIWELRISFSSIPIHDILLLKNPQLVTSTFMP
ncbi:hypothetical protein Hanom_Chr15g01343521 [Helianthus anomalus]